MATRCLYCGGSSWRPFRWLSDQEFCSNKHKELYRARLQRVVGELTKDAALAPAQEMQASPPKDDSRLLADVLPSMTAGLPEAAPAEVEMAPSIVVSDRAVAQELTEILHLEKEGPTTVWLPPDIFGGGLQPREGQTYKQTPATIAPVPGAGARASIRHMADALPPTIESRVQIKRWGLKIQFQKS
ncbi:MAG: hypothetical protein LAP39_03375 [Acidobacteriia bacterium]|nr:hypothetical protein [Terriglobia bacterium]